MIISNDSRVVVFTNNTHPQTDITENNTTFDTLSLRVW